MTLGRVAPVRLPRRSSVDALVLAGGRSRRFGSDKRLARLGRDELVRNAVRRVRQAVDGRVFVATGRRRERLPGTASTIVVADRPAGKGPLGGIAAALELAAVGVVVLACDVPRVRPATLRRLAAVGRRLDRPVAVRGGRGWEPLVAYYPAWMLNHVRAAIRAGALAPHRLLDACAAVALAASPQELGNVNTTADLAAMSGER